MPNTRPAKVVEKSAYYRHPPEAVWAALTNGEALAQWLMPNNFFVAEQGRRFQFRVDPMPLFKTNVTDCQIIEFDPPRRMVWSWKIVTPEHKKPLPTMRIEWTLTPEDGGTRLTLRQTQMEGLPWIFGLMMSFGWGTMLKRWLPPVIAAFDKDALGRFRYQRLAKPLNRGHHGVKTVPPEFFR
jgi:uncharacterized protein YndB with AHSA1/START domain